MDRLDQWISKVTSGSPTPTPSPSERTEKTNISPPAENKISHAPREQQQQQQQKPHFNPRRHHRFPPRGRQEQPPQSQAPQSHTPQSHPSSNQSLRAIPLGGLNEVGRNCMAYEYGNDIILVDAGVQFPDEEMFGVNCIIPDTRYVEKKKENIRGIIITHGHLDHIGGLPYILPRLGFPPIYASPLTGGLIRKIFDEHKLLEKGKLNIINPDKDILRLGNFTVEFFHVNHSIPDSSGLYIQTPNAKIVHTGDFKFDFTPADGIPASYEKLVKIGERGVDAIFADSTNADKEGFCISERIVGETLEKIIKNTNKGRLFISSFSSILARWQQVINYAQKYNRKVYVTGRSLLENLRIAVDLGFIMVPKGVIHNVTKRMHDTPKHEQLIISTGCQGEESAALSRIVRGEHDIISIEEGDTVVFSASPIPGNERKTVNLINELYKQGAHVVLRNQFDVHTSGHGHQGDLKLMYSLLRPKNFVPVHGEYYMRAEHKKMIERDLRVSPERTALIGNGEVIEVFQGKIHKTREKNPGERIYVDGKMIGDVGNEVQKERKDLMMSGVISFSFHIDRSRKALKGEPVLESLGFLYPHESKTLHALIQKQAGVIAHQILYRHGDPQMKEIHVRKELEDKIGEMIEKLTGRTPRMICSLIMD